MKLDTLLTRALLMGTAGFVATSAQAQFIAPRGDLLWAAREVEGTTRGAFDVVVDLGSYTRFTSGTDPILLGGSSANEAYDGIGPAVASENRFANASIVSTFGNLDNVLSSVFGVNSGNSPTANSGWFLTKTRTDLEAQSTPWNRASAFSQGGTGNKMETVRNNAVGNGLDFNATSTKEDTGISAAYGNASISPFTGYTAMEANTGSGFTSAVRMDLYDVLPGSGPANYLGYFEYQGDGDLWWVPENYTPVPEPSTYGVIAGAGLLAMSLFRRFKAARA